MRRVRLSEALAASSEIAARIEAGLAL